MAVSKPHLTASQWRSLVQSICRGDCILMLGPDAIQEQFEGTTVPAMKRFAEYLCKSLGTPAGLCDPGDCFHVAQLFKNAEGINTLRTEAREFFSDSGRKIHVAPLIDLVSLPFPLIVTTSPGRELEGVLDELPGKGFQSELYHARGPKKDLVPAGTKTRPLIYHLCGCIDSPNSLVLSESDLLDFLVAVVQGTPKLPANLSSLFKEQSKSCLFVGFGFGHWHLRILLHVLYGRTPESRSFALEHFDAVDPATVRTTKFFFQKGHRILFFDMDVDPFARELRERVEKAISEGCEGVNGGEEPEVFICHAHEDAERARKLMARLRREGREPWLDRANLRGGDRWEELIKDVVSGISYFVVLETPALLARREGFVFHEISAAKARLLKFAKGRRFVIPVRIEPAAGQGRLPELEHLNAVDLQDESNIEDLLRAME